MASASDNTRGAFLMVASMTAFTINDAFLKSLSDALPLFQALFLRGIASTLVLWVLFRRQGGRLPTEPRDRRLTLIRTGAEIAAAYFFLTALFNMPIANATAILQTLPLAVTLAGALLLKETVGWRRLFAIGVGFFGVILIVQPGGAGFTIYSVYCLAAVVAVTIRDIATRGLGGEVSSLGVAALGAAGVTLFAGVASLTETWAPITPVAAGQLIGSMVFIVAAYVLSVMVMRVGEIGVIAPFRYTSLVVALVIGYVVFGEWPDSLSLVGAGLVVGAGIFTLLREAGMRRRARGRTGSTDG
ncbi:MAG: DMT family transporter [Pseudomonadota bacterium]